MCGINVIRSIGTRVFKLTLAAVLATAGSVHAATYSFEAITNNNAVDVAIGEAQLSVDVTDPLGANNVLFTFKNTGPFASSITDIYFDDGTLLALSTITNGPGVDFSVGAAPGNLPGGNALSPAFNNTAGFASDSNPPTQPNGVNPGEWVSILFTLQSGQEFNTVLDDLQSGALRIGIHVQGFATGGSESFVHTSPIPEPEIYAMLGLGLGLMGWVGRRKKLQAAA